ncbi:TPA: hypothetical protein TXT45_000340 [Streptococcus suis]|uniref:hypothetical protein n=1 Tax=Streptococcus suis TaxID=1307 RepID=UPI0005BA8AA7|nr:hypothetical protein [Streptococcus suis]MCQ8270657.1 hypothetical protein [Streptococcus suis]MEE3745479.1 hypothetical protein [Streptococcus suis]NQH41255.1 hypothetical protein [Streptococcus suis]NQH55072.1 hypothetical protein [Streptococcus suis]NQN62686.1 hypothetical protein [Streptococcus suis]
MDIWHILSLIGLGLSLILLLTAVWIFYDECDEQDRQVPTYSQEDMTLAEFLETRQAINEEFLAAQNQLLKELFSSRSPDN